LLNVLFPNASAKSKSLPSRMPRTNLGEMFGIHFESTVPIQTKFPCFTINRIISSFTKDNKTHNEEDIVKSYVVI